MSIGETNNARLDMNRGRAAVAGNGDRDRPGWRVARSGDPCDSVRQRSGHALSDRDAVPDHRRRRGLRRGSDCWLAEFPDRVCVAATGHGPTGSWGIPTVKGPRF